MFFCLFEVRFPWDLIPGWRSPWEYILVVPNTSSKSKRRRPCWYMLILILHSRNIHNIQQIWTNMAMEWWNLDDFVSDSSFLLKHVFFSLQKNNSQEKGCVLGCVMGYLKWPSFPTSLDRSLRLIRARRGSYSIGGGGIMDKKIATHPDIAHHGSTLS